MISKKWIVLMLLVSQLSMSALWAQQSEMPRPSGTRKQMATIVYSGLAGFVLGLSTLSFYGRPQDRLGNLGLGFGLGIIIGSITTSYSATSDPDRFYGREASWVQPAEQDRLMNSMAKNSLSSSVIPVYTYSKSF